MTEFEQRHINCFETIVRIVLGLFIYSAVMAAGGVEVALTLTTEWYIIGVIAMIIATIGFILYMASIIKEFNKIRESFIPKENN